MDDFWEALIREHGRKLLFIDSGAILGSLEHGNYRFTELLASFIDYNFVTSTYVIAETVRRLVKAKPSAKFLGPGGERYVALARYLLNTWLDENAVRVICIPSQVFDAICVEYLLETGCSVTLRI